MVRPIVIYINPVELKYDPFMISLKKCTHDQFKEICVLKETKDINVKAFHSITSKSEAKAMTEQISCDCKCKFNFTICNSNQKWNSKTCHCECKHYQKIIIGILAHSFVRIVSI